MSGGEALDDADGAAEALLDVLFQQSPVGLHLLDTDLRVLRVNIASPAMRAVREEDLVGRPLTDAYGLADAREIEERVRAVLDGGEPLVNQVVRAWTVDEPERERTYSLSAFRLQDRGGNVFAVALQMVDVTERERARLRLRVLARARERVGRTLDVLATCRELADVLVPDIADTVTVDVVDAVIHGDEPAPADLVASTPLRRAAFRTVAEGYAPLYPVGTVYDIPGPTPYTQALSDLRPRTVPLLDDPAWIASDPARVKSLRELGAHSMLVAPLTLHGSVLGLVTVYRHDPSDGFGDDDTALLLEVADHAALCIDNARRYSREHALAATLQRYLLPPRRISRTALDVAPASPIPPGGGQWTDVIGLPGARTALVVGNVAGQGIAATTAMGQLRTVIRALAGFDLGPDELLARLHDTTLVLAGEVAALPVTDPLHAQPLRADCLVAVYDPLSRRCTVARSGSAGLVIAHPDGTTESPEIPAGPPLGEPDQSPFGAVTVEIPDDAVLALSTLANDAPERVHGPRVITEALSRPRRPLQELCDEIVYTLPPTGSTVDVTFLLARTKPFPADQVAGWRLDAEPGAVAVARRHVRDRLAAWDADEERAFAAELIVSELVTNAVRHARAPIELRLIMDGTLTCEVRDASLAAPHLRHARTVDEGGRGLFIVGRLSQDWGTRYTRDGKTIWAELA
ncbi:SpoIIE family protein phosphatase [Streptacidiphilus neutrinimicus]|uniref:SpoIIE family protein phosphatase n=1 Tax=Streptacidiphilus neutrinimicus TaxID=105420 RepID=UPI0005A9DA3C|nr:SpoIIE family protein phosphatase [Streptacidiphilus neutrinimicus]